MKRQVYVVRGSEDGNLGVYSSASKAMTAARKYAAGDSGRNVLCDTCDRDSVKRLREGSNVTYTRDGSWSVTGTVEPFTVD